MPIFVTIRNVDNGKKQEDIIHFIVYGTLFIS